MTPRDKGFLGGLRVAALLAALGLAAPALAECVVRQDDGRRFADLSVKSCQAYYPPAHACARVKDRPSVCATQDMIKAVNWNGVDMIINPHRGVWGLGLGPNAALTGDSRISYVNSAPENSFSGARRADYAGFRTVEYDLFLARNDSRSGPRRAMVTHFTDLRGFTDYRGPQTIPAAGRLGAEGFLMSVDPTTLPALTLRDRDGRIAPRTPGNRLMSLSDFLREIMQAYPDMVVVLDPKFARELNRLHRDANRVPTDRPAIGFAGGYPPTCKDGALPFPGCYSQEMLALIAAAAQVAQDPEMQARIIFKLPQVEGPSLADLRTELGSQFDKFLYAPQPATGGGLEPRTVLDFIRAWQGLDQGRMISFWDTTIRSHDHWMGRPFSEDGVEYLDLMDYLRVTTGRRSAIWTPDPSGPGGRHGNYAFSWTLYGNNDADFRGDGVYNLSYSGARHALITSDRPDLFIQIRSFLTANPPGAQ